MNELTRIVVISLDLSHIHRLCRQHKKECVYNLLTVALKKDGQEKHDDYDYY